MAREVLLPKLGLTMQEGTIVEWVARPGDTVREGDVLLRMATDKVDVDVEAEGSGVFRPVAVEGATVPAGARIAWLFIRPGHGPPVGLDHALGDQRKSPIASGFGLERAFNFVYHNVYLTRPLAPMQRGRSLYLSRRIVSLLSVSTGSNRRVLLRGPQPRQDFL